MTTTREQQIKQILPGLNALFGHTLKPFRRRGGKRYWVDVRRGVNKKRHWRREFEYGWEGAKYWRAMERDPRLNRMKHRRVSKVSLHRRVRQRLVDC